MYYWRPDCYASQYLFNLGWCIFGIGFNYRMRSDLYQGSKLPRAPDEDGALMQKIIGKKPKARNPIVRALVAKKAKQGKHIVSQRKQTRREGKPNEY